MTRNNFSSASATATPAYPSVQKRPVRGPRHRVRHAVAPVGHRDDACDDRAEGPRRPGRENVVVILPPPAHGCSPARWSYIAVTRAAGHLTIIVAATRHAAPCRQLPSGRPDWQGGSSTEIDRKLPMTSPATCGASVRTARASGCPPRLASSRQNGHSGSTNRGGPSGPSIGDRGH